MLLEFTWANFRVVTMPSLRPFGVPPSGPGREVFETFLAFGVEHQLEKAATSPAQQSADPQPTRLDVRFLESLCYARSAEEVNLLQQRPVIQTPIFPHTPAVGIASCRCLIRFLLQASKPAQSLSAHSCMLSLFAVGEFDFFTFFFARIK